MKSYTFVHENVRCTIVQTWPGGSPHEARISPSHFSASITFVNAELCIDTIREFHEEVYARYAAAI